MSEIDLALFDLAGTIIKPDPPVEIQYEEEAKNFLPPEHVPPRSTIRKRFRVSFSSMGPYNGDLRYGTTQTEGFFFWKRVIESVFPTVDDDQLQILSERLYDRFKEASAWAILSGAQPVLDRLANDPIDLALLTNWDRRARSLVENLGLDSYFSKLFISSEVGREKPDPAFFMEPVKAFDTSPENTLMVGNQPGEDLEPAEDVGMNTLLVIEGEDSTPAGHLWHSVAHSWLDVSNRLADGQAAPPAT